MSDPSKRWMSKAETNIGQWGVQEIETLLLAMQEELGELVQSHLEATHENGRTERVQGELDDLAALCYQLQWGLESRDVPSGDDETETGRIVTTNPTECPACGSAGSNYNHGTQEYKCPEIECGVNWFYRGKVESWQPPDPLNYDRGADGRSVEEWEKYG